MKFDKAGYNSISEKRLTLTWDVLKCVIETLLSILLMININMRCIEMLYDWVQDEQMMWLTLTWDVLKFCNQPLLFLDIQD